MTARVASILLAVTALVTQADYAGAQTAAPRPGAEPLQYTVSFPAPHTHYADVTIIVPTSGRSNVEMMMAVWTPGSYLVREFERNVEGVVATGPGGRVLAVGKSDKNRWRIETGSAASITVRYRVYGHEMSVRTNWIDAGFALLNGAPTFMTLAGELQRPHDVTVMPAQGWRRSLTSLDPLPGEHRYRAPDYDTLVDSPILVGNPAVHEFEVDGTRHYLVNEGESGVFDGARAVKDVEALVRENRRMWGSLPYERYIFFNVLTEASGGLEHKSSAVLMASRWATRTPRAYASWLELVSHEFVHAWNVKRLRPVELGPFDYESEVHTRSLWIAEGITDYYANLILHRAGLARAEELLDSITEKIEELQASPGRLVQSASQASYDAWIKYYRPDENSSNTSISYYTKGGVLGFLLDARIRAATNGARSLDDVMVAAYAKYSGERGYTPEEFRAVAEQVAGVSLASFWENWVDGTSELDYREALATLGLRFRGAGAASTRPWLGIATRNDGGRLLVSQVRRESPASNAGLNVDDEILAIDDFRVRADRLDNRLEQYRAGDKVTMLVARREQLLRLPLTIGNEPPRPGRLELDPSAPERAVQMRTRWLRPERN